MASKSFKGLKLDGWEYADAKSDFRSNRPNKHRQFVKKQARKKRRLAEKRDNTI